MIIGKSSKFYISKIGFLKQYNKSFLIPDKKNINFKIYKMYETLFFSDQIYVGGIIYDDAKESKLIHSRMTDIFIKVNIRKVKKYNKHTLELYNGGRIVITSTPNHFKGMVLSKILINRKSFEQNNHFRNEMLFLKYTSSGEFY